MLKIIVFFLFFISHLSAAPRTYSDSLVKFISKEELISKTTFKTHLTPFFERLHQFNEKVILQPFYAFIHAQAYFVQPFPGHEKENPFWKIVFKKGSALLGCCFTALPACHSLMLGLPLRFFLHGNRPFFSYMQQTPISKKIELSKSHPLHIASFNVSFTPSSVNIKMDLRPPVVRAKELVRALLQSEALPEILMIEEGWHEEALKIFCNELQKVYPYILHSIAPQVLGMSSGCAVFSLYPIEDVKYIRLEKMPPPHDLPPRGILRLHLQTSHGPLYIYGSIHTQSMNDLKSVQARLHQIQQISQVLKEDEGALQIVMGDLNTTPVDMWGFNNLDQPEGEVWRLLNETFDDLFLRDHDPITGERVKGAPLFLKFDNEKMGVNLPEPTATWYDGPFLREPEKSKILAKMHKEYEMHGFPSPQMAKEIKEITWGTKRWFKDQSAMRARFDYILLPKNSPLDGRIEIRRIVMEKGAQSPASDHLPIHGLIWIK